MLSQLSYTPTSGTRRIATQRSACLFDLCGGVNIFLLPIFTGGLIPSSILNACILLTDALDTAKQTWMVEFPALDESDHFPAELLGHPSPILLELTHLHARASLGRCSPEAAPPPLGSNSQQ